MALCGMTAPHFTTIAHFVSSLRDDIALVFAAVLAVCDGQGLIGREMFAIDGVKLPSNASKHRSGTRAEFMKRAEKMQTAAQTMLDRHRATDAAELEFEPDVAAKTTARIARLTQDAHQVRAGLATHPRDRQRPTDGLRKSNRTDNESAKMATDNGVIQGHTGVAAVYAKHQSIVEAQAHGTASEQELLLPVVEATAAMRTSATVLTTDAGYHNKANPAALTVLVVPALIADPDPRQRDEQFADREHHATAPTPLHDKSGTTKMAVPLFALSDVTYHADARTCVCPAGKSLYRTGATNVSNGYIRAHFRDAATETHATCMQQRLEAPEGRAQYEQRLPRSSRCSPMCGTTNDWIASRCLAAAKSTASNCSLVWCGVTHEARGVRAVANALIARMAMHYRSFMPNRMTARCFCATRDLHHRCVQAFSTATTLAFCCRTV